MATRRRQEQQEISEPRVDAPAASGSAQEARASTADWVRFCALQHGGLALAAAGVALLVLGYDAGWMHPTHLCLLALVLCLLGLGMHETRPVKRTAEDFTGAGGGGEKVE
ncbi:hypothetical protein Rsub_09382 [Raphidocelis subcapitata]|uniref:Uncharacterized protein n=1 Tax=Raphidocelis subcapitata TaxID=307507 RepID=A0A2V0P9W5_9CHLO|nr:hypothetical protein Rsub_09382 [Raphidocelis subcapitata]|eukprot:GBF96636.1 hypothetical protein Rsub_09382 [Raphidocelis subcapitata]